MNNSKRKMEVMAMPNTRAYVMRTPNRDKAIKLEAYKEFAELAYENIQRNEGLYAGQMLPRMWASFAVEDTLNELEAKLSEEI